MSRDERAATDAAMRSRHVVVDGLRLHYLEGGGGGRAVVFLHGGGLSAHTWDHVGRALRPHHRCFALDLRGHGDSEWSPTLDYGVDAHARDLAGFVEHLGLDGFFLVGHSLGGFAAVRYASHQPTGHLAGLVVVDASPFVGEDARRTLARVRTFIEGARDFGSLDDAVDHARTFDPHRSRERLRASLGHALRRMPDGRWAWKRDQRHLDDGYFADVIRAARALVPAVGEIRCPLLVVRGEHGGLTADDAVRFAALARDGRVVTVAGAGHNVQSDEPAALAAALGGFFTAASGAGTDPGSRPRQPGSGIGHRRSTDRPSSTPAAS